ncbi:hypothetical protein NDU88_003388 [Pleurodeles waltl]|uniref:Uncharacterized protein n=1 Tax=Pleurodeles waltl TaxID=8319 RepID=A0AAV7M466_PLEWA|nr:hypothetical protein NDU88_003388 [Pleurodeles waltl]
MPDEALEGAVGETVSDLKQILTSMRQSLSTIERKIDALIYRIDQMSDRLDEHAERLEQLKRKMLEAEDEHCTVETAQKNVDKLLLTLQAKAEDLEALSRRNNVRIVGIAESTQIDNMERYMKHLLSSLLGHETFTNMYVVELAHFSLEPRHPPGVPSCPIIARPLNYRDRDRALQRACDLGVLHHKGTPVSLFPDFTQVQEPWQQFLQGKRKL